MPCHPPYLANSSVTIRGAPLRRWFTTTPMPMLGVLVQDVGPVAGAGHEAPVGLANAALLADVLHHQVVSEPPALCTRV